MKNKVFAVLMAVLMFLVMGICAVAQSSYAVVDEIGLLDADELSALEGKIEDISYEYDFDITLIITEDTEGYSLEDYAEGHYGLDLERDGVVFAHDISGRDYMSIGRGYGASVISDAALDKIDSDIVPYLQDGDYYGAYNTYLDLTAVFLQSAYEGTPYEGETGGIGGLIIAMVIGLVGGFIIALVVTGGMKAKMNTARKKREATSYVRQGSFNLMQSNDRFLFENTTRTAKEKKSSGSNNSRGGRGGGKY